MVIKKILFFVLILTQSCLIFACEEPDIQVRRSKKYEKKEDQWPHLRTSTFKERQKKAAQFVQDCDTIIEIGGNGVPISSIIKDKNVIVIDPAIKRKEEGTVTHIKKSFENWTDAITSTNYAVIILGMELEMHDAGWRKLYDLIDGSKKTVIEYCVINKKAKSQYKDIIKNSNKKNSETIMLDLANDKLSNHANSFSQRTMHYLE